MRGSERLNATSYTSSLYLKRLVLRLQGNTRIKKNTPPLNALLSKENLILLAGQNSLHPRDISEWSPLAIKWKPRREARITADGDTIFKE